jgi:hypothetical protein
MRTAAVAFALVALAAGCGGGGGSTTTTGPPETAYLTNVEVEGDAVTFEFKSAPGEVKAGYQPRSQVAECGSGAPVRLKGSAFAVVHFVPAASAEIKGEEVVPTYTGPKRIAGPGPVLETARMCDFEADLGWAIGVAKKLPIDVSQDGSTVTVSFG